MLHPTYKHLEDRIRLAGLSLAQWSQLFVCALGAFGLSKLLPLPGSWAVSVAITVCGLPAAGAVVPHLRRAVDQPRNKSIEHMGVEGMPRIVGLAGDELVNQHDRECGVGVLGVREPARERAEELVADARQGGPTLVLVDRGTEEHLRQMVESLRRAALGRALECLRPPEPERVVEGLVGLAFDSDDDATACAPTAHEEIVVAWSAWVPVEGGLLLGDALKELCPGEFIAGGKQLDDTGCRVALDPVGG